MRVSPYYCWDLETFLKCFLFIGKFVGDSEVQVFELSSRKNQRSELLTHLSYIQNSKSTMVGFNSLGFDEPIINDLMTKPYTFDTHRAYLLGQEIITGDNTGFKYRRMSDRIIPQIDLYLLSHFNNKAKSTSLKALQFAMRSESVEDLPFHVDRDLSSEEMDQLVSYGIHDVTETEKFFHKNKHLITMRQDLLSKGVVGGDVLNYSDVKIGVEYLIRKIGRNKCFSSGSTPKQSIRESIPFKNIILPKIEFRTKPFQEVHEWFKQQTIRMDINDRPKLNTKLGGLDFHFGVGGVHASVSNKQYNSNSEWVIKDIDVSGMYVAVAIANGFSPEHLGQSFITAYKQLQSDRKQYPKGTSMNAVLKLAGNGVYGNSNNPYSCFYDPKYTFSVTVNGQLQLLQLVEYLSLIPQMEIIQANTDGVTCYLPRKLLPLFDIWQKVWEDDTGLALEEVTYDKMWIRDVNNYLVLTDDGKIKAKGAYWYPKNEKEYEGWWNKDFSNMIREKGIEQVLVNDLTAEQAVTVASDPFDFMMRYKTPGKAKVYLGDQRMPKTVRYYVSKSGQPMKKIAPPRGKLGEYKRRNKLTDHFFNKTMQEVGYGVWDERIHTKNKGKYVEVTTSIEAGRLLKECNVASKFDWNDVDVDYYIAEINKLRVGN